MAKPNSRQSLADYALRALGAPVIEINVDDDQLGDRLDEALQIYQEYHGDGVIKRFYAHEITQVDVDNKYFTLPESFLWVSQILPFSTIANGGDFRPAYQMMLNDFYGMRYANVSLTNYVMIMQHLSLLENIFDGLNTTIDFNRHMSQLHVFERWGTDLKVGTIIVIEAWEAVNPSDYTKIYNDMFLKQLFTALVKRQWGINLKKFGNMTLPGGVTIDGQAMYDEAVTEINDIRDNMQLRYETPPAFFCG